MPAAFGVVSYTHLKSDNDYAQLVKDVNDEQLALIATMKAGVSYVDYHIQFHQMCIRDRRMTQRDRATVEVDLLVNLLNQSQIFNTWQDLRGKGFIHFKPVSYTHLPEC